MPIKDPVKRAAYHKRYMDEVWYPKNRERHLLNQRQSRKNKTAWWTEYKSTLSCTRCGESEAAALDFHHVDSSTKDGNLTDLVRSYGRERIMEEIQKCIVVCANCHRKIHAGIAI